MQRKHARDSPTSYGEADAAPPSLNARSHRHLASVVFDDKAPLACQDGRKLYVVILMGVMACLFREAKLEVTANWSIANLAGPLEYGGTWTDLYTLLKVKAGAICGFLFDLGLSIPATRAFVRAQIVTDLTRAYICAMSGPKPWSEAWKLPTLPDGPRMQNCTGQARRNGMFAAYGLLLTRDRLEGVNRDLIDAARTDTAFGAFVSSTLAAPGASGPSQSCFCVHAQPTHRVARKRLHYEASPSDSVLEHLASLSQEVDRLNEEKKPLRESNVNRPSVSAANARRESKARLERFKLQRMIFSFLQTNRAALDELVRQSRGLQAARDQLQAFL